MWAVRLVSTDVHLGGEIHSEKYAASRMLAFRATKRPDMGEGLVRVDEARQRTAEWLRRNGRLVANDHELHVLTELAYLAYTARG